MIIIVAVVFICSILLFFSLARKLKDTVQRLAKIERLVAETNCFQNLEKEVK